MVFLLRDNEYRHGQLFEDPRKAYFVGRGEYTEMINEAFELLARTSRHFGGSILRGGRRNFRNEHGCGGRTSVVFTKTRGRGDQGGHSSTSGSNSHKGYTVPGIYGNLYRHTLPIISQINNQNL